MYGIKMYRCDLTRLIHYYNRRRLLPKVTSRGYVLGIYKFLDIDNLELGTDLKKFIKKQKRSFYGLLKRRDYLFYLKMISFCNKFFFVKKGKGGLSPNKFNFFNFNLSDKSEYVLTLDLTVSRKKLIISKFTGDFIGSYSKRFFYYFLI